MRDWILAWERNGSHYSCDWNMIGYYNTGSPCGAGVECQLGLIPLTVCHLQGRRRLVGC
jgi:hypothetical protein